MRHKNWTWILWLCEDSAIQDELYNFQFPKIWYFVCWMTREFQKVSYVYVKDKFLTYYEKNYENCVIWSKKVIEYLKLKGVSVGIDEVTYPIFRDNREFKHCVVWKLLYFLRKAFQGNATIITFPFQNCNIIVVWFCLNKQTSVS